MNKLISSKTSFAFAVVLLEWYEFTAYNFMIPYGVFGGRKDTALYLGFASFAFSFFARPIGSLYFATKKDRTASLRESLRLMFISTLLIGFFPPIFEPIKAVWFMVCKVIQGFALGGSYGASYLLTYESEEKKQNKQTNYKLALVQTGWVWGMLIGGATIFMAKLLVGNFELVWKIISSGKFIEVLSVKPTSEFISFGWRMPFLISGSIAAMLYLIAKKMPAEMVSLPDKSPFKYAFEHCSKNFKKFVTVFFVIAIDMVISHIWFTYSGVTAEASNSELRSTFLSNLRLVMLLIFFPIFGFITDQLNKYFDQKGNQIMLSLVCVSMIVSGFFAPWSGVKWVLISSIISSACFGSLIGWFIGQFKVTERQFLIGPLLNIVGAFIGGTTPLVATCLAARFGESSVGIIMFSAGVLALISLGTKRR